LYQTSLHYDRETRTWLIVGETALVASATMFVWELTATPTSRTTSRSSRKCEA
jgi:hypothetical protein